MARFWTRGSAAAGEAELDLLSRGGSVSEIQPWVGPPPLIVSFDFYAATHSGEPHESALALACPLAEHGQTPLLETQVRELCLAFLKHTPPTSPALCWMSLRQRSRSPLRFVAGGLRAAWHGPTDGCGRACRGCLMPPLNLGPQQLDDSGHRRRRCRRLSPFHGALLRGVGRTGLLRSAGSAAPHALEQAFASALSSTRATRGHPRPPILCRLAPPFAPPWLKAQRVTRSSSLRLGRRPLCRRLATGHRRRLPPSPVRSSRCRRRSIFASVRLACCK